MLAAADAFAKKGDEDDVRPADRAAVAACLAIAARAPKDDVASPTGAKVDPKAWMEHAAKTPEVTASSCVGVVSAPCLQDPNEYGTTSGMAECVTREYRVWDERLNAAYKEWVKGCPQPTGRKDDKTCAARRKLERAWIAYRDALCDLPFELGGSIAILDYADCMMRETARQAIWIEQQK
jgi:uncharacterized protein YecT (DUF1311 family)